MNITFVLALKENSGQFSRNKEMANGFKKARIIIENGTKKTENISRTEVLPSVFFWLHLEQNLSSSEMALLQFRH